MIRNNTICMKAFKLTVSVVFTKRYNSVNRMSISNKWQMVAGYLCVADRRVDEEYYYVPLVKNATEDICFIRGFQSNVFTIITMYCSLLGTTKNFDKNILFLVGCTFILLYCVLYSKSRKHS